MALTQEQVDWWFSQNPNATADEVAAAVVMAVNFIAKLPDPRPTP